MLKPILLRRGAARRYRQTQQRCESQPLATRVVVVTIMVVVAAVVALVFRGMCARWYLCAPAVLIAQHRSLGLARPSAATGTAAAMGALATLRGPRHCCARLGLHQGPNHASALRINLRGVGRSLKCREHHCNLA